MDGCVGVRIKTALNGRPILSSRMEDTYLSMLESRRHNAG